MPSLARLLKIVPKKIPACGANAPDIGVSFALWRKRQTVCLSRIYCRLMGRWTVSRRDGRLYWRHHKLFEHASPSARSGTRTAPSRTRPCRFRNCRFRDDMTAIAPMGPSPGWPGENDPTRRNHKGAVPGLTLAARGVPSPRAKTAHTVRAKDMQENETSSNWSSVRADWSRSLRRRCGITREGPGPCSPQEQAHAAFTCFRAQTAPR